MNTRILPPLVAVLCAVSSALAATNLTSTLADQTKVAVTVYNNGFGVVRDERRLTLPVGDVELRFMEVASVIQPETVQIDPLTAGGQLAVREQNYEYDLLSPAKLLEKYVGKTLTLIQRNDYKNARIPVAATLLSFNDGQPIFKIGDEIVLHRPSEEIHLATLPENLVAQPTLVWLLANRFAGAQTVVANYMTGGMDWRADYVAVLTTNDSACNLNGWVTINNNCGATFRQAQLKLVAGDVQRVSAPQRGKMLLAMAESAPGADQFREEGLFEYHLYTLQRPSTLKQNQQKQISLLEARNVPVAKTYRCIGQQYWFRNRMAGTVQRVDVGVFVSFTNSTANGLGMPLPKGIVRVYKADTSGNNQFVGEDSVDHTPKNERITLKLGNAFDIVAERRQTDYTQLSDTVYESAWTIQLRNHKDEDVLIEVVEPIGGDWTMLKNTHAFEKRDAATAVFSVPVKANGTVDCSYRVRVK
jgi:hypothetical protein